MPPPVGFHHVDTANAELQLPQWDIREGDKPTLPVTAQPYDEPFIETRVPTAGSRAWVET